MDNITLSYSKNSSKTPFVGSKTELQGSIQALVLQQKILLGASQLHNTQNKVNNGKIVFIPHS